MAMFGFFNRGPAPGKTKSNVKDGLYNNDPGLRKMTDDLKKQDAMLKRVNKANERYKKDGNLDAIIKTYEAAFFKTETPCVSSQNFKLVDFYLKAGRDDDAWGYLNFLYSTGAANKSRIRLAQAKMLKKEKKYKDAIEMYALGYFLRSKDIPFSRKTFLRDISSPANRLGLSEEDKERIADLVEECAKTEFSEAGMKSRLQDFLSQDDE